MSSGRQGQLSSPRPYESPTFVTGCVALLTLEFHSWNHKPSWSSSHPLPWNSKGREGLQASSPWATYQTFLWARFLLQYASDAFKYFYPREALLKPVLLADKCFLIKVVKHFIWSFRVVFKWRSKVITLLVLVWFWLSNNYFTNNIRNKLGIGVNLTSKSN